jgi:predicted SprT family Zn-dependent metalloprotease
MDQQIIDPTGVTYGGLGEAYDFFNERLFGRRLPRCLITMQRKKGVRGYFASKRFGSRDGDEVTDEIALNPVHFRERTTEESLSTLAHEMVHLEQFHFGKPPRRGYHDKEWAGMMRAIGLIPSHTGEPGGRPVGQKVTHYIAAGGRFAIVADELIRSGFTVRYVDQPRDQEAVKKKAASKTKYTCPGCGLNAWAKPDVRIACIACVEQLLAEGQEGPEA